MPFVQASAAMGRVLAEHHAAHVVAPSPTKAKRGDVVAFVHKSSSSYVNGPNQTRTRVTIGEVTSATRDGQVKEFRDFEAGTPRKLEHAGLEHAERYILPSEKIADKAGLEEHVRSRGVLAGSGNYKPIESIEEAHAAIKPYVHSAGKGFAPMDVIQKAATVSVVESENPNGEFEVILSTEARDRDDENLWADEWKQPLPPKIHIDGDHGRSLDKTVGSAVPRLEGNQLVAKGTFASTPYAQMVRQLVNEGHINSLSVTYSESKNQKGEGVQRELLNAAFVAIPANPEAVVLASKNAKVRTGWELKTPGTAHQRKSCNMCDTNISGTDYNYCKDHLGDEHDKADGGMSASGDNPTVPKHDDMIQAIHDAACHLGAQCVNEVEADPGTSDGANKSGEDIAARVKSGLMSAPEARERFDLTKSSSLEAGSPDESADEDTAAAAKAAAAVDKSADETAAQKAKELEIGRGLKAYLKSKNMKE